MLLSQIKIFIAYSRKDIPFLDELRTHLNPLERTGKVKFWYDGEIEPGQEWEQAIKENLYCADIILLLVSADTISSNYFYEKEMMEALERHKEGTIRVIPIIVRPCIWKTTPLANLQALPKDGTPITSSNWKDKDHAYENIATSLWSIILSHEKSRIHATQLNDHKLKEIIVDDYWGKEFTDFHEDEIINSKVTVQIGGELSNRGVLRRAIPIKNRASNDRGTIVLDICVDKEGNVISAGYTLKGSTTNSTILKNLAIQNAKIYQFAKGSVDKQCGIIRYEFK